MRRTNSCQPPFSISSGPAVTSSTASSLPATGSSDRFASGMVTAAGCEVSEMSPWGLNHSVAKSRVFPRYDAETPVNPSKMMATIRNIVASVAWQARLTRLRCWRRATSGLSSPGATSATFDFANFRLTLLTNRRGGAMTAWHIPSSALPS